MVTKGERGAVSVRWPVHARSQVSNSKPPGFVIAKPQSQPQIDQAVRKGYVQLPLEDPRASLLYYLTHVNAAYFHTSDARAAFPAYPPAAVSATRDFDLGLSEELSVLLDGRGESESESAGAAAAAGPSKSMEQRAVNAAAGTNDIAKAFSVHVKPITCFAAQSQDSHWLTDNFENKYEMLSFMGKPRLYHSSEVFAEISRNYPRRYAEAADVYSFVHALNPYIKGVHEKKTSLEFRERKVDTFNGDLKEKEGVELRKMTLGDQTFELVRSKGGAGPGSGSGSDMGYQEKEKMTSMSPIWWEVEERGTGRKYVLMPRKARLLGALLNLDGSGNRTA